MNGIFQPQTGPVLLATVIGIDLKSTGVTTLFTHPNQNAIVTDVLFLGTNVNTFTVNPTVTLGDNSASFDNWTGVFGAVAYPVTTDVFISSAGQLLAAYGTMWLPKIVTAGNKFSANITVGATATALTITAYVLGFLI